MDWDKYLNAAVDAGEQAGQMLRASIDKSREITFKGAVDLVTDRDKESQQMIFSHLSALYPEHDFLAEEDLCEERGTDFRWIIDPIDGTTNYAHSFPFFCVSIALEWKGGAALGVIYDPMREEMFTAVADHGAYLNGKRIYVSSVSDLNISLLATGFPYDLRESKINNFDHFVHFAVRAQAIRRCGSAALDLCYVACGRFDGFWEMKLSPWDVAAGALIVQEAGGRVSDFGDEEYSPYGKEVLASNVLIHPQMLDVLRMGERP
ncbi:inositol monophosphatase family protein [Acidobacteriota bacterium]